MEGAALPVGASGPAMGPAPQRRDVEGVVMRLHAWLWAREVQRSLALMGERLVEGTGAITAVVERCCVVQYCWLDERHTVARA